MKNILKVIPIIASIIFLSGCTGASASESVTTETAEVTAESSTVETTTSDFGPAIDNDDILVYTIDTSIRTDFLEPAVYQVISRTAVWTDETRTDVSRYLEAGETVTVTAEVGESSRVYALLDTGEYVLLAKLEVAKTTDPSETSEETSQTIQETSSASETTAAWTETAVSKTVYATGSVNIRLGAGTSYSKVRTASYGEALEVTAETSNGWYKLSDGNYISRSVTSETVPTPAPTQAPAQTAAPAETTVVDHIEAGGTDNLYTGAMEYRHYYCNTNCEANVYSDSACTTIIQTVPAGTYLYDDNVSGLPDGVIQTNISGINDERGLIRNVFVKESDVTRKSSIPRDATLDALAQQRAEDLAWAGALDNHAGFPRGSEIESLGGGNLLTGTNDTSDSGDYLYFHADGTCSATSIGIGRATHYYADGSTYTVICMEMVR